MARFRKGKKAYKKGEGVPLWWNGSTKQRNLQVRYYVFILVKEWEAKIALKNLSIAMAGAGSALQIAGIQARPRPIEMSKEDFARLKALDISQHVINAARTIADMSKLPPKPRFNDHVKPLFTSPYERKPR